MAQLMPLPLTVSCSRLVLPFLYQLTQVVLEKRPLNGCCCCSGVVSNYDDIAVFVCTCEVECCVYV